MTLQVTRTAIEVTPEFAVVIIASIMGSLDARGSTDGTLALRIRLSTPRFITTRIRFN